MQRRSRGTIAKLRRDAYSLPVLSSVPSGLMLEIVNTCPLMSELFVVCTNEQRRTMERRVFACRRREETQGSKAFPA